MDDGVVLTTTSGRLSAAEVSSTEEVNRAAPEDIIKTRPGPNLVGAECGRLATRSQSSLVRTTRTLRGTAKFPSDRAGHHDPGKSGHAPTDTCPFTEGNHKSLGCLAITLYQNEQDKISGHTRVPPPHPMLECTARSCSVTLRVHPHNNHYGDRRACRNARQVHDNFT